MGNNDYVKNISICEMLKCEEDESKVLVLVDDPNSDLEQLVRILCDAKLLSYELNFPKSLKIGFGMKHISELNNKNISTTFNEILS
jgi:hypothetical protein